VTRLSPQQAAVVAAAADGAPLAVVGARVGISRAQAAGRLSEAYRRLDVAWMPAGERRAGALRAAVAAGLIDETAETVERSA
jgi:hypothetical protein